MPNLSKKKGRRRADPEREVGKAQRILEKHKTAKFLQNESNQGQSWKYGHLTPNQVMTGSDKLFHKKVIKISKSRGLNDDNNKDEEDPYYKSQYNDDRNLTNFEHDQIFRHQVRAINDNSDIDPSDDELEDDSDALQDINENDDIFAVRRNKEQESNMNADDLLESSGDDLDRESDDLLIEQNDDTLDIDDEIKKQINIEQQDDKNMDLEQEEMDELMNEKKSNKRGRRATNINLNDIERQIMNDNDENTKRLLNVSKQFMSNKNIDARLYDDSDGSSYYHSSSDGDIEDIERNKYKDDESRENDDDYIAEPGVGKLYWGDKRSDYYGADGVDKRFKSKTQRAQYQELRDEEAIGIQMQKDEMRYQRKGDFMDLEMEQMMEEEEEMDNNINMESIKKSQPKKTKKKKKNKKYKDIAAKFSSWFNDDDNDEFVDDIISEKKEENKLEGDGMDNNNDKANVEKIKKDIGGGVEGKIIKRDHPELPGMLKELREIVDEMKMVYNERQKAIQKRFDDAIEDSTLFIELLRTYSSTICFYLQLKVKKANGGKLKKQGIYTVLLKLKRSVSGFRKIYKQSMEFMNNLPNDWDRKEYLKQKRELFEYERKRQQEVHEKRMMEEMKKKKIQSMEKRKLRKKKKKEEELKKRLFKKGFNRLNNEDIKLEGEDVRRGITSKIFKSSGLKRYRKQGIPRVKARIKFDKKMKLWKRKGYKTYKGKIPNGRMEYNINTGLTHSKRLT